MPRVLIARPASRWRQVPVAVLLWVAQTVLGLVVLALRTARAALTLAIAAAGRLEQQLATRTGRPVLSQSGIAAVAMTFVTECRGGWQGTPTR